jgi:RNA polymerase sigma factor (sigma-70 family)
MKLTAYARSIVYDFHDAEDVYQNVSLKAVRSAAIFNDTQHLVKWSWTVCRTESIKKQEEQNKRPMILDEQILEAIQTEFQKSSPIDSPEVYLILKGCLEKLSSFARQLITLRYCENLTGPNLAQALNRKVKSIYVALSRTHQTLHLCMQKQMHSIGE